MTREPLDGEFLLDTSSVANLLADEVPFKVIHLRSDARGGAFSTKTDPKEAEWTCPSEFTLIRYEEKILDQGGDRSYKVVQTEHGINATTWAKGHPIGERDNRSYIELEVTAWLKKK